jgi:hypothetical protein
MSGVRCAKSGRARWGALVSCHIHLELADSGGDVLGLVQAVFFRYDMGLMRDAGYREALVAYIDILGFRKLIETSAVNPSTVTTLLNVLSELKQQTSGGGRVIHEEGKQRPTSIFRGFNFSVLHENL